MSALRLLFCTLLLSWSVNNAVAAPLALAIEGVDSDIESNITQQVKVTAIQAKFQQRQVKQRIAKAIRPFGYYQAKIKLAVSGKPADTLNITIDLGEAIKIDQINIHNTRAGENLASRFTLQPQQVFVHREYEGAKSQLLSSLVDDGYLDAKLVDAEVGVSLKQNTASIKLTVDSGPRYRLGPLRVRWSKKTILSDGLITRHRPWEIGDHYHSDQIIALRTKLQSLSFVEKINLSYDKTNADDNAQAAVIVDVTASGARNYSFGVGYGTDTGPRISAGIHWRWLNANGDSLRARASANEFTQKASLVYDIPTNANNDASWQLEVAGKNERGDDTQQYSWLVGGRYLFSTGSWQQVVGVNARFDRFTIGDTDTHTDLLMPSWSARKVKVDDIHYVRDGYALSFQTRGSSKALLSDIDFIQFHARVKYVLGFSENWRIHTRAELGATLTDDFAQLAPDLRFYTGGDRSIRGYKYQRISPVDSNGNRIGGKSLLATSLELDYRFAEDWAVASFVDAGVAGSNINPDSLGDGSDDAFRLSTGLGIRWFSPVGTVKLDVAVGLNDDANPWRIHVTLGPDL